MNPGTAHSVSNSKSFKIINFRVWIIGSLAGGLASIPKLVIGSNAQACIVILKKPFVPTRVRIETFQQAGDPRVPI